MIQQMLQCFSILFTECVQPIYDPGHYVYRSTGFEADTVETCGLYIIAAPDKLIQVEFDLIDVSCKSGLVAVSFIFNWSI
jgi:hypothetical protein